MPRVPQEKVEEKIANQPVARGLTKVVEEDGFKTVFVLRLSPVLPIPAGSYPYIYGTSKLNPLTFAAGYFLGSMKPYLLDAYLGIFSKQVCHRPLHALSMPSHSISMYLLAFAALLASPHLTSPSSPVLLPSPLAAPITPRPPR